jgi:hypothetical protein
MLHASHSRNGSLLCMQQEPTAFARPCRTCRAPHSQASVHALEKVFKEIREHLGRENATIPKVRGFEGRAA